MDQFTKEGRKLRPRRTQAERKPNFEKVEYDTSSRTYQAEGYGEHRNYGERRTYGGERRSHDEYRNHDDNSRPYSERRPRTQGYGQQNRSGSYGGGRKNYSRNQGYGRPNRGGNGEGRNYGESRGYGEGRNYSEGRNYGEARSYGESRGYGNYRGGAYGEQRGSTYSHGGGRPSYRDRAYGEERGSYGESRGTFRSGERPRRDSRPGFNNRNTARKRPYNRMPRRSSDASFQGINRMIERRPIVNGNSTDEQYVVPVKDVVRLNKFIANSGVCSRREADTMIQAGVVTVNGEVVTELGTKININTDDVRFNGERLKGEEKVYIIMNKPKGYVTTASDPHADKTVVDLVKNCPARVYPVGRLDKNTTGVLLLTNDGELAERLTHPSYDKKKIYQVLLDKELKDEDRQKILEGVELSDGMEKADELEYIDEGDRRKLGIEIHSGKNRIVRRLFESLGYTVRTLDRVYFAGLTKKGLKKAEWRYLNEGEVNILKMGAYV